MLGKIMKPYTKIMLILFLILSVFLTLGWLVMCLLPVAMSFDSGINAKTILMDIALTLGPILILWGANIAMWMSYHRDQQKAAWSIMIVVVVVIALGIVWLLK